VKFCQPMLAHPTKMGGAPASWQSHSRHVDDCHHHEDGADYEQHNVLAASRSSRPTVIVAVQRATVCALEHRCEHVDGRHWRQTHDRLLEAVPSALVIVLLLPMVLSPFLGETTADDCAGYPARQALLSFVQEYQASNAAAKLLAAIGTSRVAFVYSEADNARIRKRLHASTAHRR